MVPLLCLFKPSYPISAHRPVRYACKRHSSGRRSTINCLSVRDSLIGEAILRAAMLKSHAAAFAIQLREVN
jgi:hypothetical protein